MSRGNRRIAWWKWLLFFAIAAAGTWSDAHWRHSDLGIILPAASLVIIIGIYLRTC
jgi:hypothetical protein